MQSVNLLTIFLTGLLTGGLTCMAVQGGLLAATIAQREEARLKEQVKKGAAIPILSFLAAKLTAYSLLGLLLGWFGSLFKISLPLQVLLQFAVALFMIGTALNILNIHPIFRYFVIQPPRFLMRLVRRQSKSSDIFAPATLGAFTVFIPCGTTQAMMALAVASGNPLFGAAILFSFVLGTSPVFFLLGYFATKLGDALQAPFMRFAAGAIILLAIYNINNAINLTGTTLTPTALVKDAFCFFSWCSDADNTAGVLAGAPTQDATIAITNNGYSPDQLTVKAGSRVTINLKNINASGCQQTFTIPSLNIQKTVLVGNADKIAFTAPNHAGTIPFMCSMGMWPGVIRVVD